MFNSRKGKLDITTQLPPPPPPPTTTTTTTEKIKPVKPVKLENPDMPSKSKETIIRPILLLSLLIGYFDRRTRLRGVFGGLLWIVSLTVHTAFDFLSGRKTYGYAWVSIQMLSFLALLICTYSMKCKAVPWLNKGLNKLEGADNSYNKTFARLRKVFRVIPIGVILFSVFGTGLEFFCYWYDNAFSVAFEQKIPAELEIFLKVVWFITNVHVLYAFGMFWSVAMCNMYTAGYSMIEYHETMATHLKNKETPVTFRQAVHSFAERGKFLKKSSSACRVSLSFLLVYSIASLAVNAFYYLYKTRKAGYIYFALMPPICSVYPLCLAAWVTKQYKWYLAVVVKAWAERPESTDEEEESESDHHHKKHKEKKFGRKFTKRIKSARKPEKKKEEDHGFRRRSLFPLRQTRSNPLSGGSYSDTESRVEDIPLREKKRKPIGEKLFPPSRNVHFTSVSDNEIVSDEEEKQNPSVKSEGEKSDDNPSSSRSNPNPKLRKAAERLFPQGSQISASTSVSDMSAVTDDEEKEPEIKQDEAKPKVDRKKVMEIILRGTARAVGRLQHRAKLPKFNFEKYIAYLQNVIPTIGFDIMGITVTWNMVSSLLFLQVSLLALFVQESIFGSQNAQVNL